MGGGGPLGACVVDFAVDCSKMTLDRLGSPPLRRRNHPLLRFDFRSSSITEEAPVRLGGLLPPLIEGATTDGAVVVVAVPFPLGCCPSA